jgi:site-specific DNA-cytosine methylase
MRWVELFAGAGGASLGIRDAGGASVAHVEWDKDAAATLRAAGFDPVFEMDVREWTKEHGSTCGAEAMWASYPCQCWSTAGKRLGALDPRNGWPWTVAAIDAVRPEWFVAENVPGLAQHSEADCGDVDLCPGCYFGGVVLPQLRNRFAWVGVWRLDAADFGIPQRRRRLFMVAGPHAAKPPAPTHADPMKGLGLFTPIKPWVTLGEALGLRGVVGTGQYTDIKGGGRGPHEVSTERPSPTVRVGGPKGGAVMYVVGGGRNPQAAGIERTYRELTNEPSPTVVAVQIGNAGPFVCDGSARDRLLDRPAPTICAADDGRSVIADKRYREALLGRPAPTVTTTEGNGSPPSLDQARKVRKAGDALHLATGRRRLRVDECAKLQGFPADHPWRGTKTSAYRQIGNACPPALTAAVVRSVTAAHLATEAPTAARQSTPAESAHLGASDKTSAPMDA